MFRYTVAGLVIVFLCTQLSAQVPPRISWQGYVSNASGPLSGTVDLVISLYESESGGTHFYRLDTTGVVAEDGVVNVPLGPFAGASLDSPAFVGVAVNGGPELVPRTPLRSVPYALAVFGMRAEAVDDGTYSGVNVLGGASNNTIAAGVVGGTVSGGGGKGGSVEYTNAVAADYGTVGGGRGNSASGGATTVGGGGRNTASSGFATVAGGYFNTAGGEFSIVGGGEENTAGGSNSTAAGGLRNKADGSRATVGGGYLNSAEETFTTAAGGYGNDRLNFFRSGVGDVMTVQSNGRVSIWTLSPGFTLEVNGSAGKPGSGSWSVASDARL